MATYQKSLNTFKSTWASGLMLRTLMLCVSAIILCFLLVGIIDYHWALSGKSRTAILWSSVILATILFLFFVIRPFFAKDDVTASLLDSQLETENNILRSAYDLSKQESPNELHAFLKQKSLNEAHEIVTKSSLKKKFPIKLLAYSSLTFLVLVISVYCVKSIHPKAFAVISERLIQPHKETAPFTKFSFNFEVDKAEVIYGSNLTLKADITGDTIKEPVICLIRNSETSEIQKLDSFQQSQTAYSKTFPNVVSDFEVAFSTGIARSKWIPVEVLLQPKFTGIEVTVTPPSYTSKKVATFPLDGNTFSAIEGSKIDLKITSNRPLSGGSLTLTELTEEKNSQTIEAHSTENSSTLFSWKVHRSSTIDCIVRDIRETPSASTLQLTVNTIADAAPVPELTSPSRVVLATPRSMIPLVGEIEDDYGLKSVTLVRSLFGFRDRSESIADEVDRREFSFENKIDLGGLGVLPDQILEFYLEAADHNPSLLGIGTSDVVRVHIISEEQYAERIRRSTTLEVFGVRFQILRSLIREARLSLESLDDANTNGNRDAFEKSVQESIKAHRESRETAQQLANDFHAYKMEEALGETAQKTAEALNENFIELHELNFDDGVADNSTRIETLLNRLGGLREKSETLEKQAKQVNIYGKAMKLAVRYRQIYEHQRSIAMRITNIAKEINKGITRNRRLLPNLANMQERNKSSLENLLIDIKELSETLPDEFQETKDDLEQFAIKAEELQIADAMQACSKAAKLGQSIESSNQAHLALRLLEQLLELKVPEDEQLLNSFSSLCKGNLQRGKVPVPPNVEDTLEQMLQAMMQRVQRANGGNRGGLPRDGNGQGGGHGVGDGHGMSSADYPMFGPDRLRFDTQLGHGKKLNKNARGSGNLTAESTQMSPTKKEATQPSKMQLHRVPENYKDAVKKFYATP